MPTIRINSKSKISDIINGNPSGVLREYIHDVNSKSRLSKMVNFAYELEKNNTQSFIEVKFSSQYHDREKRIEVVGKKENQITLYKFSSFERFDKDAIELNRILSEIQNNYIQSDFNFKGVLLFDKKTDSDFIYKSLSNMNIDILISNY